MDGDVAFKDAPVPVAGLHVIAIGGPDDLCGRVIRQGADTVDIAQRVGILGVGELNLQVGSEVV